MQIQVSSTPALDVEAPLLVLPVFQGETGGGALAQEIDGRLGGGLARSIEAGDFDGKDQAQLLVYPAVGLGVGAQRVLFLGAGERKECTAEGIRKLAARAVRRAEALRVTSLALHLPAGLPVGEERTAQSAAEGAVLAGWDYRELRGTAAGASDPVSGEAVFPLVETVLLVCTESAVEAVTRGARVGSAFAKGENLARLLQSRPGNIATPTHLAGVALDLAESLGFTARILGPAELREERMEALLAVSAGSDEEPRLIVLEHRGGPAGEAPLAIVGKGLTFDSGGISIKPGLGMEEMKFDMSGGAAVLGAMQAVGTLSLPVNVVAVIPSSENLLNGRATKPGDVIRTRGGKTVEVINTDAEGRLILADALSYVIDHFAPCAVVDCATLTGAAQVALGNQAAALLGTDEALIAELREAGDRAEERCWPLPLWKEYRTQLDSPVADLKNVGGRSAGTITAAYFLREFVGDSSWAHLDIAATAYGDPRTTYYRKGAFGHPTRLLLEWLQARAG